MLPRTARTVTDVNQSSRGTISGLWEGPWGSAWFYCGGGLVCLGKIDTKQLPKATLMLASFLKLTSGQKAEV